MPFATPRFSGGNGTHDGAGIGREEERHAETEQD